MIGLHVPVKEISETQKSLGEHMVTLPKFKCVKNIEGDQAHKCIMFKAEGREELEKYAQERGYKVTEEKVPITYDNINMSKTHYIN